MKPFNADKGLRKLKTKKNINNYIKYGTLVVSLLLFIATVIFLTRATYTSRHDFELINAKVGEFTLNVDINLHATCDEEQVTLSTNVIHARRKTPIGVLPEPSCEGYVFLGWFAKDDFSDGSGVNDQTAVYYGLTDLYASFKKETYELSLDLNGGELVDGEVAYQVDYKSTQELPEVTREGYTFDGWEVITGNLTSISEQEEDNVKKYIVTMGKQNSIVRAKWNINTYNLTIKKENGDEDDLLTIEYNQLVPLSRPSKTGHTFTGWTNIEKLVGGRMPAEDVTLTANYTPNTYKWLVNHYKMNVSGSGYDLAEVETGQGTYGTYFNGTLKNYTGFTNPTQASKKINVDKTPDESGNAENNILDYNYVRNRNLLTVNLNGGLGSQSQNLYYQETMGLSATREGYNLSSWTVTSGNATVSGSTVTMGSNASTVRANWSAKSFTVSYNVNGGNSVSPSSKTVYYDSTYGTLPSPTRTGYTFAGWFTAATNGEQITASNVVKLSANQTIYAHWTPKTYTVTLNQQSGSGGSTSVTATYDQPMPSAGIPTRAGYTFGGYYTSTGGSGTQYYSSSMLSSRAWNIDGNTTLYAKWTVKGYTVTINKTNVTTNYSSRTINYGSSNTITVTPSSGYYLKSASCTNGYTTNAVVGENATSTQTVTIYNNNNDVYSECTFVGEKMKLNFLAYLNSLPSSDSVIHQDETSDKNMRFIGGNPSNYVSVPLSDGSEELFRVVGVFNSNSHGYGDKLVKIVKTEAVDPYNIDVTSGGDDKYRWYGSDAESYLNGNELPYSSTDIIKTISLKTGTVSKEQWSNYMVGIPASDIYTAERTSYVDSSAYCAYYGDACFDYVDSNDSVGVLYYSDYLYAFGSCTNGNSSRSSCLTNNSDNCSRYCSNWFKNYFNGAVTLTTLRYKTSSYNDYQGYRALIGEVGYNSGGKILYPVVYLSPNIKCLNCDDENAGTSTNPWRLDNNYLYYFTHTYGCCTSMGGTTTNKSAYEYASVSSLVSKTGLNVYVEDNNGTYKTCYYYDGKSFCLGEGYWNSVTGYNTANYTNAQNVMNSLKSDLEAVYGSTASCSSYSSYQYVSCSIGGASFYVHHKGYAQIRVGNQNLDCEISKKMGICEYDVISNNVQWYIQNHNLD